MKFFKVRIVMLNANSNDWSINELKPEQWVAYFNYRNAVVRFGEPAGRRVDARESSAATQCGRTASEWRRPNNGGWT